MTINGHFFNIIYTFLVWIEHGCLTNKVYAMDPNKCYKEIVVYMYI